MIEEAKGDSEKVWKVVNEACNRNSSSESIQCIISDGVQHITSQSIASSMNSFFASIGRILASGIQTSDLNFNYTHNTILDPRALSRLRMTDGDLESEGSGVENAITPAFPARVD